jgi:diacylglycerol kinase family enzyme
VVLGNLVYLYGALRALAGWKPATFTLELDGGERRTVTGYTIAAANSKSYGGGMLMAPSASLRDGLLDVVIVADTPKLRALRGLPTIFKGEHVQLPYVDVVRSASVRIAASRPFTLYADGDPIAELPVTVRALPEAIRVIVPNAR